MQLNPHNSDAVNVVVRSREGLAFASLEQSQLDSVYLKISASFRVCPHGLISLVFSFRGCLYTLPARIKCVDHHGCWARFDNPSQQGVDALHGLCNSSRTLRRYLAA